MDPVEKFFFMAETAVHSTKKLVTFSYALTNSKSGRLA